MGYEPGRHDRRDSDVHLTALCRKVDKLGDQVADFGKRVGAVEGRLVGLEHDIKVVMELPIDAARLRWSARSVMWLIGSIIIPILISASATWYGISSQVDDIADQIKAHITYEHEH